jgi:hypothetical protein
MIVQLLNNELEGICKEAFSACLKGIYRHVDGGIEENKEQDQ